MRSAALSSCCARRYELRAASSLPIFRGRMATGAGGGGSGRDIAAPSAAVASAARQNRQQEGASSSSSSSSRGGGGGGSRRQRNSGGNNAQRRNRNHHRRNSRQNEKKDEWKSSFYPSAPKKLLLLDLNGLLIHREKISLFSHHHSRNMKEGYVQSPLPSFFTTNHAVYERPGVSLFLEFCFKHFEVAAWTSCMRFACVCPNSVLSCPLGVDTFRLCC